MKKKIVIEMDDREGEFQMLADVSDLNLELVKKRLYCGDFIYKGLLIERKEISDLCSSILDGRMKGQVEKMQEMKENLKRDCYVIIVGALKDRKVDIHENCVLGTVNSLVIKHGMKVLWCETESQFLWVLRNLCEKYDSLTELEGDKKKCLE